jgi:hypothetical protein
MKGQGFLNPNWRKALLVITATIMALNTIPSLRNLLNQLLISDLRALVAPC